MDLPESQVEPGSPTATTTTTSTDVSSSPQPPITTTTAEQQPTTSSQSSADPSPSSSTSIETPKLFSNPVCLFVRTDTSDQRIDEDGDEDSTDEEDCYEDDESDGADGSSPPPLPTAERCKKFENFPTDFKLEVLHWAYSKTIHSAGHHFRLQRYIVRNWMMNEEKIIRSASERGKRKWRKFDERVMRHLSTTRPVYGRATESRLMRCIDELTFSASE